MTERKCIVRASIAALLFSLAAAGLYAGLKPQTGLLSGQILASPVTAADDSAGIAGYEAFTVANGGTLPGTELLKLTMEGRHEEARVRALARIAEIKDDIDAYVSLSWSLVALGRYPEAAGYARKGYSLRKDPRLAQAIGEASFHLGGNDEALAMLQEYIASYPEGPRAGVSFYLCGELYLRKGFFMHADIAFSTAVQYSPSNPQWWIRLGWARENSKKLLQALRAYEKALSLNPSLADAVEGKKRIMDRYRE